MVKTVLLVLALIGFSLYGYGQPKVYNGNLTEQQFAYIKNTYPWQKDEFILINFRQPLSSCHYDQYNNIDSSTGFDEFYKQLKLEKISNIFVYSDTYRARKKIDDERHFGDKSDFFLNNFFSVDKSCYGIMVINEEGKYYLKIGEYIQKDIIEFVNNL